MAAAFPEFSCTPIRVPTTSLHLKSLVTMAGPDILAVSELEDAKTVLKVGQRGYRGRWGRETDTRL